MVGVLFLNICIVDFCKFYKKEIEYLIVIKINFL